MYQANVYNVKKTISFKLSCSLLLLASKKTGLLSFQSPPPPLNTLNIHETLIVRANWYWSYLSLVAILINFSKIILKMPPVTMKLPTENQPPGKSEEELAVAKPVIGIIYPPPEVRSILLCLMHIQWHCNDSWAG